MRAICKVCKDKDTCSYIKQGKTSDCIDVQTSDYGYEEAVEKAKREFCKARCPLQYEECEKGFWKQGCLAYFNFSRAMKEDV